MPVLPQYEAKETLDPDRRGMPRPDFSTVETRAAEKLGAAVSNLGAEGAKIAQRWAEREQQKSQFSAGIEDDVRRQELAGEFDKMLREMPADGSGFHDTFLKRADELTAKRLENMPSDQREKYAARWQAERQAWANRAAQTEAQATSRFASAAIGQQNQALLRDIDANPAAADYAIQRGLERIQESPLPPAEKAALARAWETSARAAELRAKRVRNGDVSGMARDLGMPDPVGFTDVVDRIEGVESGGNPNAKNPNSSATGAGQFIDSTWLAMIRKHRPDLAAGSDAEVLALRSDRELSREMIGRYAQDNARILAARGIPTTPGNVYLAHFLGPDGAAKVAGADANTPVSSLVDPAAIKSNPSILANKTAGEVVDWATRKMGGRKGDARYAALPANEAQALLRETMAQARVEAANVRSLIADDHASVMKTGEPLPDLTTERVARTLGLAEAAEFEATRSFARTYWTQTRDWDTAPAAEILERVEALRPLPGVAGFAHQERIADAAAKRAQQVIKQRQDDPGGSVDNHATVKSAMAAVRQNSRDPAAWRELVRSRLAAQEAIGIPEASRAPLSNAEAVRFFAPVLNAPEAQQVRELRKVAQQFDAVFGEYAPRAFAAAISGANLDKATRDLAGGLLRKLGMGEKPSREELQAFEESRAAGIAERAANNVVGDEAGAVNGHRGPVPSTLRTIPNGAIEFLQKNPGAAGDFLTKYGAAEYGPGVAARVVERLGLTPQKGATQ